MDVLGAGSASLSCGKRGLLRVFLSVELETVFSVRVSLVAEELEEELLLTVLAERVSVDERPRVLILVFLEGPGVRELVVVEVEGTERVGLGSTSSE